MKSRARVNRADELFLLPRDGTRFSAARDVTARDQASLMALSRSLVGPESMCASIFFSYASRLSALRCERSTCSIGVLGTAGNCAPIISCLREARLTYDSRGL